MMCLRMKPCHFKQNVKKKIGDLCLLYICMFLYGLTSSSILMLNLPMLVSQYNHLLGKYGIKQIETLDIQLSCP